MFFSLSLKAEKDSIVVINTGMGQIKLKLYKETPVHRSNFIKLVNSGFYNDLLFHRVIESFMIQGGDPDSRNAAKGVELGNGEAGEWLNPEFNPSLIHKRGALAAARESDDINPDKKSSSCQFYIVEGKKFTVSDLEVVEKRINNMQRQNTYFRLLNLPENSEDKKKYFNWQKDLKADSLLALKQKYDVKVDAELATKKQLYLSELQRKTYMEIGGTPHLDGNYTVFGEVIEGMDVVERIARVEKDKLNRPLENIRMTMHIELEEL